MTLTDLFLAQLADPFRIGLLIALIAGIGLAFGWFVFSKTAREGISDGH